MRFVILTMALFSFVLSATQNNHDENGDLAKFLKWNGIYAEVPLPFIPHQTPSLTEKGFNSDKLTFIFLYFEIFGTPKVTIIEDDDLHTNLKLNPLVIHRCLKAIDLLVNNDDAKITLRNTLTNSQVEDVDVRESLIDGLKGNEKFNTSVEQGIISLFPKKFKHPEKKQLTLECSIGYFKNKLGVEENVLQRLPPQQGIKRKSVRIDPDDDYADGNFKRRKRSPQQPNIPSGFWL